MKYLSEKEKSRIWLIQSKLAKNEKEFDED